MNNVFRFFLLLNVADFCKRKCHLDTISALWIGLAHRICIVSVVMAHCDHCKADIFTSQNVDKFLCSFLCPMFRVVVAHRSGAVQHQDEIDRRVIFDGICVQRHRRKHSQKQCSYQEHEDSLSVLSDSVQHDHFLFSKVIRHTLQICDCCIKPAVTNKYNMYENYK